MTQYQERHVAKRVAHIPFAGQRDERPDREEYHKRGFGLEPKAIQIQLNDVWMMAEVLGWLLVSEGREP